MKNNHHSDFIPFYLSMVGCESYLELGIHTGETFLKSAKIVSNISGVDTVDIRENKVGEFFKMTTDEFFKQNKKKFDVIFIDADHSFLSVKKDFENSLAVLNKNGTILLHDTDPISEEYSEPRYCGDAYRIIDFLEKNHPKLSVITFPFTDAGLTIVRRKNDSRVNEWANVENTQYDRHSGGALNSGLHMDNTENKNYENLLLDFKSANNNIAILQKKIEALSNKIIQEYTTNISLIEKLEASHIEIESMNKIKIIKIVKFFSRIFVKKYPPYSKKVQN